MKKSTIALAIIILVLILFASLLITNNYLLPQSVPTLTPASVYVGVTYGGSNIANAKLLIDKVKNYTNLFVIQSGQLEKDHKALTDICKYAINSGLYVIVYFSAVPTYRQYISAFLSDAQTLRNGFLGIYFDDEPGGKMLDSQENIYFYDNLTRTIIEKTPQFLGVIKEDGTLTAYINDGSIEIDGPIHIFYESNTTLSSDYNSLQLTSAKYIVIPNGTIFIRDDNGTVISQLTDENTLAKIEPYQQLLNKKPFQTYDEAARIYISTVQNSTSWPHSQTSTKLFTSDYALYWYDYLGGYDVILAELGWNSTSEQQIALTRGAANLQDKDWGTIITWKYDQPPYLGNGTEMYDQMRLAYESGSKYIVIFNYPEYPDNNPYGVLQEDHFEALQKFWNKTIQNKQITQGSIKAEDIFILPNNYGWGLRSPQDNIWGLWQADNRSRTIWDNLQNAIMTYGSHLDIIYDNPMYSYVGKYKQTILWNQTSANP
jgi:hypothetical protein